MAAEPQRTSGFGIHSISTLQLKYNPMYYNHSLRLVCQS